VFSKKSADPDLSYWYRPHRSTTKLPILFLHGIGVRTPFYVRFNYLTYHTYSQIGIWPYLPFFSDLIAQDPDVGILIIEILPISMHMTSPPLSRDANCRAISRILASLRITRITLVAHSYGTVLTTHILHDPFLSPLISSTLFIDPIPFLLHLPDVAFNFVYRKPRTANEWELWYFASRDADISRALSRHFFWAENVLWKEELDGRRVAVVLCGADQIVHAQEVRKYLTGEQEMSRRWKKDGLEVLFYPGLDHAMVFDTKERRKPVLDILHRFVRLE
jgi:pimeloyl-ACP methyl ester carboxylesterase